MAIVALLSLVPCGPSPMGAAQAPPDVSTLGPQVGEQVPDFTLSDQTGTARSLQSLVGPNGALLVFFRSADW
jgi:hypothetical protein